MKCDRCEEGKAYNRAIVDQVAAAEIGHLCRDCESDVFGEILGTNVGVCNDGCVLCNRDSTVVLPRWRGTVQEQHGRMVNHSTYTITENTPGLCDEHALALLGEAVSVTTGRPPKRERPADEF